MNAIVTTLRRWGNSLGLTLPAEFVKEKNVRERDRVKVTIERVPRVEKLFGTLKVGGRSTQDIKDGLREEW
jgi:antitoxin component of MazEF toxin-antitoxin module